MPDHTEPTTDHTEPTTDHTEPTTDQIARQRTIPAPPKQVWEAITSDGWLAETVAIELVPGGEARFGWPDGERRGWVEEALAPDPDGAAADRTGRLVFWWAHEDEPASRVELTLEPEGPAYTRVRVLETRPLETLDLIGVPLPGSSQASHGPLLLAVA
jgi:uncharacterized protein YndB with AHSA1/START domain